MSEVEDMELDFPVEQRDVFAQSELIPASLVTAAGRIGLVLEISIYPCCGHQEGEGSGAGDAVTAADAERMALSWLEIQRHRWAYEAVDDLVSDHPAAALLVLDAMVAHAGSDAVVDEVGAGPLQDLVRAHAGVLIDRLEERAAASSGWRRAFGRVWVPHRDDALTGRLEALGCIRRDRKKIHDQATRPADG